MGALTRAAIVQRGLMQSGCNPNFLTELNYALNTWLREVASRWPWPQLRKRYPTTPGGGVQTGQGTQSFLVGAGANGITDAMALIWDPMFVYTANYNVRGEVRIRQLVGGTVDDDEIINNPATNQGLPQAAKVRAVYGTLGQWAIWPMPIPDGNGPYLWVIDYNLVPPDMNPTPGSSDDATVPWYPSDRTMIELVRGEGFKLMNRLQAYSGSLTLLGSLVTEDRSAYGTVPGTNDYVGLDEGVFRTGPPFNWPTWGSFGPS